MREMQKQRERERERERKSTDSGDVRDGGGGKRRKSARIKRNKLKFAAPPPPLPVFPCLKASTSLLAPPPFALVSSPFSSTTNLRASRSMPAIAENRVASRARPDIPNTVRMTTTMSNLE
ncbi:hypothetical protein ALC56_14805 [Trachymyrmex septentrionalis]|uniref:Uncharacterized protein n=1 Tax=Trachymyrmex septentrionalis TaxID=34720 RepID=A0A195ERY8_9HYME|nr:hypothetical protein ALC56_14805 [Trachymyrmex septentrionalis]